MSDKSPRQTMAKKSGKSLKQKRAAKRDKSAQVSQAEALLHPRNAEATFFEARINQCDHLRVTKPNIVQVIWRRLEKVRQA